MGLLLFEVCILILTVPSLEKDTKNLCINMIGLVTHPVSELGLPVFTTSYVLYTLSYIFQLIIIALLITFSGVHADPQTD